MRKGDMLIKAGMHFCGLCLDIGLILYAEAVQLISILTLMYHYENQHESWPLHLIMALVMNFFSIMLLRYFSIKGMPSIRLKELALQVIELGK